jgi:hypothetical protein
MSRRVLAYVIFAATSLWPSYSLLAQTAQPQATQPQAAAPTITDQDIQLMRQDLRDQKKQIIAANLPLTPAEAEKFWPVYDQYTAETTKIGDERAALIKQYAENYGNMTDAMADSLIRKSLATDVATAQLRVKYIPIFEKVLPAKKVAMFFQLDRRIGLMIDLQLASQIPLVPAK